MDYSRELYRAYIEGTIYDFGLKIPTV